MKVLHVCAGWDDTNGVAVAARLLAREQVARGDEVSFGVWALPSSLRRADEVWVHCGWLPCLWWAGLFARRTVRMPHACYDPVRLAYHGWKKRLVGPIERFFLRRAARVVVTCEAEREWVERYVGSRHPPIEVTDIKRFFRLPSGSSLAASCSSSASAARPLHLLYLGRRHPLKGLHYLEEAVKQANSESVSDSKHWKTGQTCFPMFELKVVSNARGSEKERVWEWCDVLCLPTLSENFGLVVAEALERGKMVVTTDGAPAWRGQKGVVYVEGFREGSDADRMRLLRDAIMRLCGET